MLSDFLAEDQARSSGQCRLELTYEDDDCDVVKDAVVVVNPGGY